MKGGCAMSTTPARLARHLQAGGGGGGQEVHPCDAHDVRWTAAALEGKQCSRGTHAAGVS